MIDYSDASDLFFVWLKRALVQSHPDFGITSNPLGVQEKDEEIIVKKWWNVWCSTTPATTLIMTGG